MNFRIEYNGAGFDYEEDEAYDFAVSAQNFSEHGAKLYVEGRRVDLTTAIDIAKLYL